MGQDTRGTQGTKRIAVNAERSAGPIRTLFNKLDLLPSKLPRLFEQQWKLSTICGPTYGRFETRSRPAFARRYLRDFTFYLGKPFPRLFVCHNRCSRRAPHRLPCLSRRRFAEKICCNFLKGSSSRPTCRKLLLYVSHV